MFISTPRKAFSSSNDTSTHVCHTEILVEVWPFESSQQCTGSWQTQPRSGDHQ